MLHVGAIPFSLFFLHIHVLKIWDCNIYSVVLIFFPHEGSYPLDLEKSCKIVQRVPF